MSDVSVLCPLPDSAEERKLRQGIARNVIRKVIVNAAIHRPDGDILEELYFAGMWHGVKLSGPPARKPDIIDITPAPRRRGRPRKEVQ
jgi:hypothetical protein